MKEFAPNSKESQNLYINANHQVHVSPVAVISSLIPGPETLLEDRFEAEIIWYTNDEVPRLLLLLLCVEETLPELFL